MGEFFGRKAVLQIGTRRIEGIRLAFRVEKSLSILPNDAEITAYNLGPESRALAHTKGTRILLEVGYRNSTGLAFSGDLRVGSTAMQGADSITKLRAGDGETAFTMRRLNESFGPGSSVKDVAKKALEAMGVNPGNLVRKLEAHDYKGAIEEFVGGYTATGRASDVLDSTLRAAGLEYSIQDGAIQALKPGEATTETAVVLGPDSGLVGSPERGEDGVVKFRSLLNPLIAPGRRVELASRALAGSCRVEKVTHTGDTDGVEWYTEAEARLL